MCGINLDDRFAEARTAIDLEGQLDKGAGLLIDRGVLLKEHAHCTGNDDGGSGIIGIPVIDGY